MAQKVFQFLLGTVCFFITAPIFGQSTEDSQESDSRYLEDQFYFGVGYNFLTDKPDELAQRNLSYNLQIGFIKDIPFNRNRNFGVGLGLGYAVNSYYSSLVASQTDNAIVYEIVDQADYNRSKLGTHAVEVPFELRWRTSNAEDYKFWRIYAGAKFGYVFSGRSKLVTDQGNDSFANDDIEKFQYGLMLNFGYNTWNIHVYYGLNQLLTEDASLNEDSIDLRVLRIGLMFYIL